MLKQLTKYIRLYPLTIFLPNYYNIFRQYFCNQFFQRQKLDILLICLSVLFDYMFHVIVIQHFFLQTFLSIVSTKENTYQDFQYISDRLCFCLVSNVDTHLKICFVFFSNKKILSNLFFFVHFVATAAENSLNVDLDGNKKKLF